MPNPPVPTERKRARGNPGKRALPDQQSTIVVAPVGEPPEHLEEAGRAAWIGITRVAPWVGASDGGLLLQLCEKLDRRAAMIRELEGDSFTLVTDKGYVYANPIVGMLATVETDVVKIMSLLGLTPTDRTKLGLAEVKAQSTLDKMRQRRQQRDSE